VFSSRSLIDLRRAQGLSQEELARRAGLATVTIAKLEEGRVMDPKTSTLAKLAFGLGCTVDDLVAAKA
jgi:transcriptional regulator with XRE-family HTH domain